MTFLEPDEYALLISAIPQRWHALTEFSLASMARPSEVSAFRRRTIPRALGRSSVERPTCTPRYWTQPGLT
jgi:hypothetical protein